MATVYITEFSTILSYYSNGTAQIVKWPAVAKQTVAIGAEADSAAFNANTSIIRVHADAICSIDINPNPTATTAMTRFAANQTEYFGVNPGDKISVITNT